MLRSFIPPLLCIIKIDATIASMSYCSLTVDIFDLPGSSAHKQVHSPKCEIFWVDAGIRVEESLLYYGKWMFEPAHF